MISQLLQSTRFFVRRATLRKGQTDFMHLVTTPKGSQIPMSNAEKQKINHQIDKKLQELEQTGLSKQEILLSKSRKGLPLAIDPFFQYMKRNWLARQVYLKPDERFTVQKVIDIALRQDIGSDSSYSRVNLPQFSQQKMRAQHLDTLMPRGQKAFDPENYYANKQFSLQKSYNQLKPHQAIQHIYRPIDRYEKIKKNARKLKKYDIHWRNIELLRQFVTKFGKIRNRWSNSLTPSNQKRIEKAIKTARQMHAMPHYGETPAPLTKSITCIQDQVQDIGQQHVNLQTGHLYLNRNRSMDSLEAQSDKKNDINANFKKMQQRGSNYKIWFQNANPLERKPNEEIVNANKFARSLKQKQGTQSEVKTNKQKHLQRVAKSQFRQITGLTDQEDYEQFEMNEVRSDDPQCEQVFNKRKQKIRKQLASNPFMLSQILMQEKTQL